MQSRIYMTGSNMMTAAMPTGMSVCGTIEPVTIASIRRISLEKQRIGSDSSSKFKSPLDAGPPDCRAWKISAVKIDAEAAVMLQMTTSVASETPR